MRIMIIGAKGMLGQQLTEVFSDYEEVIQLDRDVIDIVDIEMVEDVVKVYTPDIIINAAAYNDVDNCEVNFKLAKAINGQGPINVAKVCQKYKAIFVHYSTDYVFDGTKQDGYVETDQPNPISKYGQSKLMGESCLQSCEKGYVVRTSRLFGKPAISKNAKKSFVDNMIALSEKLDKLKVVNEEMSNPTLVNDLAKQTRIMLEGDYDYGIYHGVNQGACTWYELAQEIFKILDKNVIIEPVPSSAFPRKAKVPAYSSLKNTKLPLLPTWQNALKEYLTHK